MSDRIPCASTATLVTLFEDRAEVLRTARCAVPKGVSWIEVRGVTAAVDDPSVLARLRGARGARVIATQVARRVREEPALSETELAQAIQAERSARRAREEAERALGRAQGRLQRTDALIAAWVSAVGEVPRRARSGQGGWRAAHGALDRELSAALDEVSRFEGELRAAREEEARARLRAEEGRTRRPRYETVIEVQVEAETEAELELELVYRTPCALWRPEHLAKLRRRVDGGGYEIHWQMLGTAWQRTGEDWRGVTLRFSTARPGKAASPPLLQDDVLTTRKKSEVERRTVVVEAREQAIALTGVEGGARILDDMPGVDDGGEPLTLVARERAHLPSDGQPCRVDLYALTLPCEVDLLALPERTEAVHLRARATLTGAAPLLAGPVRLFRGEEMVGSSRIGFVGRGEPFELGFGVDEGLRVRRQVETQRETGMLGGQRVTVTVRLFLSNLGGAPRRLLLTERVPVSELEDVKVAMLTNPGGRFDERDGFLRCDVDLGAGATRELALSYRIEAGARVQLPY